MRQTLILIILVLSVHAQAQDSVYKEPIAVIDTWIEAQMAYEKIPGVTVAIIKDQQLVWRGAKDLATNLIASSERLIEPSSAHLWSSSCHWCPSGSRRWLALAVRSMATGSQV